MKRLIVVLALLAAACSKDSNPAPAPTPPTPTPTPPAVTTFTLSGRVTSAAGGGIAGANVNILDGPNAGRATSTNGNGDYTLSNLTQSGFTLSISSGGFLPTTRPISLSQNVTANVALLPSAAFTRSGTGDTVFDIPTYVTRIRVDASYGGSCQNFAMRVAGRLLINIIIGTCSVADTRSPFSGTYAITAGGTAEITISTGVSWTVSEVR